MTRRIDGSKSCSRHEGGDVVGVTLIAQYRSGDDQARESCLRRIHSDVLVRARRHALASALAPNYTAEDIAQEFVCRLLASGALDRIEDQGDSALWGLLDAVLHSTIVDLVRTKQAAKRGGGGASASLDDTAWRAGAADAALASHDTSPTTKVMRAELRERALAESVRLLAPREWTVWHGVDIEGRSTAEVASRIQISESRVRALLSDARRKLVPTLGRRLRFEG